MLPPFSSWTLPDRFLHIQAYDTYTSAMYHRTLVTSLIIICIFANHSHAFPAACGVCQASCSVVAAACYFANGAIFGTVHSARASPALSRCNTAYGTCQATCASTWIARVNGLTGMEQLEQQMGGMNLGPMTSAEGEGGLNVLLDQFTKMNIK